MSLGTTTYLDGALSVSADFDEGGWGCEWRGPRGVMTWRSIPRSSPAGALGADARGTLTLYDGGSRDLGVIAEGDNYPRDAIAAILGPELFGRWESITYSVVGG